MAKDKAKISDFRIQERNANKHTVRGMGMLQHAIANEGWISAITVTADGESIDGSARLEAAYERFGEDVEPIIVRSKGDRPIIHIREDLPDASDPRAKKLSIYANRIAEVDLDYDLEILAELHEEVGLEDMFFADEIAALMEKEQTEIPHEVKEENEDELNEILDNVGKVESRVKLGEIWQLGRHKIACGDSTVEANVRALLGDRFGDVGMVWSDPPYGVDIVQSNGKVGTDSPFGSNGKGSSKRKDAIKTNVYAPIAGDNSIDAAINIFKICKSFDAIQIWWGANYYANHLPATSCWIVWDKENTGNFADAELAWSNHESAVRIFKHMWNGMIKASEHGQKRVHPTQKPIALCEWAFEKYGQSDDVIFDPFLGSAPSIIAAQKMEGDRTVYGFELSEDYCEVIIQRYENFTGDIAKLVGRLPN